LFLFPINKCGKLTDDYYIYNNSVPKKPHKTLFKDVQYEEYTSNNINNNDSTNHIRFISNSFVKNNIFNNYGNNILNKSENRNIFYNVFHYENFNNNINSNNNFIDSKDNKFINTDRINLLDSKENKFMNTERINFLDSSRNDSRFAINKVEDKSVTTENIKIDNNNNDEKTEDNKNENSINKNCSENININNNNITPFYNNLVNSNFGTSNNKIKEIKNIGTDFYNKEELKKVNEKIMI
jgi:hypothetical protein